MAIQTQIITGRLSEPDGDPITTGSVRFTLSRYDATDNGVIAASRTIEAELQADGSIALELWPNTAGLRGTTYLVELISERGYPVETYGRIQIGEDGPYSLADLVREDLPPATTSYWSTLTQAQYDAAISAATSAATDATAAATSAAQAADSAVEAALYDPSVRFKTVPDMLASNRAGKGAGTIWQAGSFLYEEVTSGEHLTTAGGVKLKVLPGADGWVNTAAVNDDPGKLQDLIDNFGRVRCNEGVSFTLTSGLSASATNQKIDFSGATFECNFEGTFFQNSTGTLLSTREYKLGLIKMNQQNSKGIDWTNFSYCDFSEFVVRLAGQSSHGMWAKGNGLGTGPYYNNIFSFFIYGMNNNATYPNQYGITMSRATSGGLSADGPNANNIWGAKRIAGLANGLNIGSGNGNTFNGIQLESIAGYGMIFNNHGGTETKALGNKVLNWRMEGSTSGIPCRFAVGAQNNDVTQGYVTSVSSVQMENAAGSDGHNNVYAPHGKVVTMDFYGDVNAASTTFRLDPARSGGLGGIAVPFDGYVHSIVARTLNTNGSTAGTATVKLYKSGYLHSSIPELVFSAGTHLYDRRGVATEWDTADIGQVCSWTSGHAVGVDVVTDASWNATSCKIHVQIIFAG
ncbi:hypothetical protein [Sulfitobacter faviae]|uniref:hypothetical protein n=1 Tax=Sulfitobacter faviae TaxID=1775881 RepID=UPI00398D356D